MLNTVNVQINDGYSIHAVMHDSNDDFIEMLVTLLHVHYIISYTLAISLHKKINNINVFSGVVFNIRDKY